MSNLRNRLSTAAIEAMYRAAVMNPDVISAESVERVLDANIKPAPTADEWLCNLDNRRLAHVVLSMCGKLTTIRMYAHLRYLGERVKRGDQDAINTLKMANQYTGAQRYG